MKEIVICSVVMSIAFTTALLLGNLVRYGTMFLK